MLDRTDGTERYGCDDPKPLELGPNRPEHLDYDYRCSRCGGVADHAVGTETDRSDTSTEGSR